MDKQVIVPVFFNMKDSVRKSMKLYILPVILVFLFFFGKEVSAGQNEVFTASLNETVQENILESLSNYDSKFNSYKKLNEENEKFKYLLFYSESKDQIQLYFYSGSYGIIQYYANRMEFNGLGNNFKDANFFTFDLEGNLISQTVNTGNIRVFNGCGIYSTGIISWNMFEVYEKNNGSNGDGVFQLPQVIIDVFEKTWEIMSNFGKFIYNIFVPSDDNIIFNFFSDIFAKINGYFKPMIDFLDDIKDLFTPELVNSRNGFSNDTYYNDSFYDITWKFKHGEVQPFVFLKPLGYKIYLLLNALLVVFTLANLIRRIMGTGDIIE